MFKFLLSTMIATILIGCSSHMDEEAKATFTPPNDALFKSVHNVNELEGYWGLYCYKSNYDQWNLSSSGNDDTATFDSYDYDGDEDGFSKDLLLLKVEENSLRSFVWDTTLYQYVETDFISTSDSGTITFSDGFGSVKLKYAIKTNIFSDDFKISGDTLRIHQEYGLIVNYIDYYYVRTSKTELSGLYE